MVKGAEKEPKLNRIDTEKFIATFKGQTITIAENVSGDVILDEVSFSISLDDWKEFRYLITHIEKLFLPKGSEV
jgi:hypothetical protein